MAVRDILGQADPKMQRAVEHLQDDLRSLRTGRASAALVESVQVEQYGQMMPLKSLATISTPDAHTIAITPWDKSAIVGIEKAIRETQSLGLNPSNDGSTIRLNVPPMTEERRREIVKALGDKIEQCNISLRNARHEVLDEVRKAEKHKEVTQDDVKFAEAELNKKIDQYKAKISEIEKAKTAEIMEV